MGVFSGFEWRRGMPQVKLTVRELQSGELPQVCIYCGQKSTHFKKFKVSQTGFLWWFWRKKYSLPTCQRHRPAWMWYEILLSIMFVIGILGFVFGGIAVVFLKLPIPLTWIKLGSLSQLGIVYVVQAVLVWQTPQLVSQNKGLVTLVFAHRNFTNTIEDWRDWYNENRDVNEEPVMRSE
jgi:hypothetical protein